ncbi:hypothetical protein MRX96_020105 [Rhipicephalus microplus]
MLTFCVLVLATANYAFSSRVSDANAFVDTIFKEKVPPLVRESRQLYPYATLGDFSFKLHKDRFTNREPDGEHDTWQGLNIAFTSLVTRDPQFASWNNVWVSVDVTDSIVHLEAKAPVGEGYGEVRAFVIKDMQLDVTYDSNLSLNPGNSEKFKEENLGQSQGRATENFHPICVTCPPSFQIYSRPLRHNLMVIAKEDIIKVITFAIQRQVTRPD